VLNPVDALTKKMDLDGVSQTLEPLVQRYTKEGASHALDVWVEGLDLGVQKILKHWILQH